MSKKVKKGGFSSWTFHGVAKRFGLEFKTDYAPLLAWLNVSGTVPEPCTFILRMIRDGLSLHHSTWNEMDYRTNVTGPLLLSVNLRGKGYDNFCDRDLRATLDGVELSGRVDWCVATGIDEPEAPFFFIHEYKREKNPSGDPHGQALAAMIAAQTLNGDDLPIYGCSIIGKTWMFILLDGKNYAESKFYDAGDADHLDKLWLILNKTKGLIEERVAKKLAAKAKN